MTTNFGGALLSPIDERDLKISDLSCGTMKVDKEQFFYDLSKNVKILNQGDTMMCTGYSASTALGLAYRKNTLLSRYFLYHNRDLKNGWDIPFKGNYLKNTLRHMRNEGCCTLDEYNNPEECPEGIYTLNKYKPAIFEKSKKYKISNYIKLETLDDVKKFMLQYPTNSGVLCSMSVYQSVANTKSDGVIPKSEGTLCGYHAISIIGFKGNYLRFVNSIGDQWGDHGFGWLDTTDNKLIKELWGFIVTEQKIEIPKRKVYKVQLGAFRKIENTRNFSEKLFKDNIPNFIVRIGDYYKVQVGCFIDKDNAKNYVMGLRNKKYNAFIV